MKKIILPFILLLILSITIQAQSESESMKDTSKIKYPAKKVYDIQGTGETIIIKDENENSLMTITDEGSAGSILLNNAGAVLSTINKLYNINGILCWSGSQLSTGGSGVNEINDLSDAKYIGYSLYLGNEAGTNDDGTANKNTGIGRSALYSNISGQYNTALGYYSLYDNNSGSYNVANGYDALTNNTTGFCNVAIGYRALYRNTIKSNLVAIGDSALFNNGIDATFVTEAKYNTAVGSKALFSNTIGYGNTATGSQSLTMSTTGDGNTANGYFCLAGNTTGSCNTAYGYMALRDNETGKFNTAIGYLTGFDQVDLNNTTVLGYEAKALANNQVRIGNIHVSSIGGYEPWSDLSDMRYKQNIKENVAGIEFIMGLRPITYNLDVGKLSTDLKVGIEIKENGNRTKTELSSDMQAAREKKANVRRTGFIAQEVEELINTLGIDFNGVEVPENEYDMYRLRYSEFVVPLVKAVQEQQEMIDEQNEIIADLRTEIDALKRDKLK